MSANKVLSMKAGGLNSPNQIRIQAQQHMTITQHYEARDGKSSMWLVRDSSLIGVLEVRERRRTNRGGT